MSKLRILVLENNSFQRAVAVRALKQMGYQGIVEATDGESALATLRQDGAVDVALCDLRMVGMDGLMFLREAAAACLVNAVVIVSELEPDLRRAVERILAFRNIRLLGCIDRPIDPQILRRILTQHQVCTGFLLPPTLSQCRLPSRHEIEEAFNNQEFRAFYLPKISMGSDECIGAEVLARWVRKDGSVHSPSDFMPVIEQYGLHNRLFEEMLEQGLGVQRLIQGSGRHFRLAFNLEAPQLVDHKLADRVRLALQRHELHAGDIVLELTECSLIRSPAASLENMVRLRMMGCGLSIDDFGVGYSSLERLCQMPFNEIKLDAGFIRNMMQQPRYRAVISNMLKLARDLGISVVAEGVETEEQLNHLKQMGCDIGQGYFYARPMSGVECITWLLEYGVGISCRA